MVSKAWLLLVLGMTGVSGFAQDKVIWRIGTFDHASGEFRAKSDDYSNPQFDPVYRVGKSKDGEDWQRFQPGTANGMAGGREHPFTILFDLHDPATGVFRLKIAVLYETPRLSHLRVDLNGHSGVFYFHPQLDYGAGDWEGTFVPQTSTDSKTIDLPAEWLRQSGNRLVLTALDTPSAVENSLGSIALGHTGLVYDALELTQDAAATYAHDTVIIGAQVRPTIFYRSSSAGLSEVVEVDASFAAMPAEWLAALKVGDKEYQQQVKTSGAFGESQLEFDITEWQGTKSGVLVVRTPSTVRTFPVELIPAKKWTIFIVPHEHLDMGFTDYAAKVAELHSQALDGVIDLMREVPDFRWTLDGYWVLDQYLNGRSPERANELLRLIKDGKIIVPPQFANQHTGVASLEGLARSLYDSHFFAKRHDLPLGAAAHITDVPSYSWSYASILRDAGVKYFAAGSNSWRAPGVLQARWNERSPFYWEGPDGGRVLMWYSRAYLQLATLFATPPRLAAVRDSLPVFLQAYSGPNYKASAAIIFGTQLENTVLSKEQAYIRGEWQKQYAWPRLEYSNFADAMGQIEKLFGSDIPVYRGDLGPYWEDGFGSDSKHTALHRQNQQRILSAEKLATIPALLSPELRPDRRLLAQAWNNMLVFDEHTWTYVGATTQPENEQTENQLALKGARTTEAEREIGESLQRSWAQFESFLGPKEPSIVVFNSLNWRRSGQVSFDLQDGIGLFDATTGKLVPYETVSIGKSTPLPGFGGGYRRVRFAAENVPGLGYKLFTLRSVQAGQSADSSETTLDGTTFENSYYRITVDPSSGAVSKIWDKELNRELVDAASAFRFGAYLYVTGADDMPNNSLYRYGATLKPPVLSTAIASHGRLLGAKQAPFGTIITMEASAPNTPTIRLEITLYNARKQIDFAYRLSKETTIKKEAVYIAFPFAANSPEFGYDTQNGWVNPAKDELPGGSHEWYAVQHWAAVHDAEFTAAVIPQDAPLVSFGDIVRGNWPAEFRPQSATIFSWVMNNYWGTNFAPQQGGEFAFHYSLVSGRAPDPADLTRLGNEAMTPLEVDQVGAAIVPSKAPGNLPGKLPNDEASLLEVDNSSVAVATWKLAEDGRGSILRLQETAGKPQSLGIRSAYLKMDQVWRCSLLEDNLQELKVDSHGIKIDVQPFEIVTLRLRTSPEFPGGSSNSK
jgi:alpha-mannosidase